MIYDHRKELENFQENIFLGPSFGPFGRLVIEKLESGEKKKKEKTKERKITGKCLVWNENREKDQLMSKKILLIIYSNAAFTASFQ